MSLAKQFPIIGILGGIALIIVGFVNSNTPLWIIGIVLIGLAILRLVKK